MSAFGRNPTSSRLARAKRQARNSGTGVLATAFFITRNVEPQAAVAATSMTAARILLLEIRYSAIEILTRSRAPAGAQ